MTACAARRSLLLTFVATNLSTGGGVNRVIRDLSCLAAEELGAEIRVISARSSASPTYAFPKNVPVEFHAMRDIASYVRVLWRLRRSQTGCVIGSWTQDNILLAGAFLGSRRRIILIEHASWNFHGWWLRALRRLAYRFAWRVVVLNPRELSYYRKFLKNVHLIPNPVFDPGIYASSKREKLIVAIGHLSPLKNFDDAVRAFAGSKLEEEGWSLAIVGSGSELQRLQALIGQLGISRAGIHDPVSDVAGWYRRASMILVTSTTEVFSLVLAEAMSAGVVPVAYESDGPAYILEDFPDHLVPLGDVDSLGKRLRQLSRSSNDQLRQSLRQCIRRRFAPEIVARQWAELLN